MKIRNISTKTAILSIALSACAFAQEPQLDRTIPDMEMRGEMAKNAIMMKDGKMTVSKDGEAMAMDKDMELSDGTKVMMDGKYMTKDGKTMMMSEGDMMTMDGKFMMGNHAMMKDGKMMVMKDGQTMAMEEDMELSDGTKVMKDGKVMMKDGATMELSEGDMVSMGGVVQKAPMEDPAKNQPQDRN